MKTYGLIYTIGYSNTPYNIFIDRLKSNGIKCLVDVRLHPDNPTIPWYSQKELFRKIGNAYSWVSELAGPTTNLPIVGGLSKQSWQSQKHYTYSIWMSGPEFAQGIKKLQKLRDRWHNIAIFCSEEQYFRCHRSLISDAWVAMGGAVKHIHNNKIIDHYTGNELAERLDRYEPETQKLWKI